MKVKAKQLKDYIDEVKLNHLRVQQKIEYYELLIETFSSQYNVSYAVKQLEQLRSNQKKETPRVRKYVQGLERVLREDEAANAWKGDDRLIDFGGGG